MADICKVPATTLLNANLYKARIPKLEVFKAETFKKFIESTMAYIKRIEESKIMVVAVDESV